VSERPSSQDWAALFGLADLGINECPWVWDPDCLKSLPGWGEDEFAAAVTRCSKYLKELGAFD
jgi:hypothetical protein